MIKMYWLCARPYFAIINDNEVARGVLGTCSLTGDETIMHMHSLIRTPLAWDHFRYPLYGGVLISGGYIS